MAGLDPAIHVFLLGNEVVDARYKAGMTSLWKDWQSEYAPNAEDWSAYAIAPPSREGRSQHLMHVDDDAVRVSRGGGDKQVFHQPTVFFTAGLETRHGAEIDQAGIDRLAAFQLLQQLDGPKRMPLFST